MFELDADATSLVPQSTKPLSLSRCRRGANAKWRLGVLLVSTLLGACVDEPGVPEGSEAEDDDDTAGVFEVLGFEGDALRVGKSLLVDSPDTTTQVLGGTASADVDLDGDDDVLILLGENRSVLLLNDGAGGFEDGSDGLPALSEFASGAVFADLDGDGAPDLLVPNASDGSVGVYLNDDEQGFEEAPSGTGLDGDFAPALGAVAADIDGDEDLDVFVLRASGPQAASTGVLWINDGEAHFSDHSELLDEFAVVGATSALWANVDGNPLPDLIIARNDGVTILVNESEAGAKLRFAAADLGKVSELDGAFAVGAADLDDDRDLDLLLSGVGGLLPSTRVTEEMDASADTADAAPNTDADASTTSDAGAANDSALGIATPGRSGENRIISNADATYVPWPTDKGLPGVGGAAFCVADFNNDTYVDVFQGTAPRQADEPDDDSDAGRKTPSARLFLQRGAEGGFIDGASLAGLEDAGDARSVLCVDYDNDGDVDILLTPFEGPVYLYRNTLDPEVGPANYVNIRVVGSDEHPIGIGTVVSVVTEGLIQTRIVGQDHSSAAQGANLLHFGLSSYSSIDTIVIEWPDDAEESVVEDFGVNATYTFRRQ